MTISWPDYCLTSFTIAVSSCALFRHETGDIYFKGAAFPFVKALTMVNQRLTATEERCVIVVIATDSQDMDHLNKSIKKYNLKIGRVCEITGEKPLLVHLKEINPVLYLSTKPQDVKKAMTAGYGAATMFQRDYHEHSDEVLRVVFDGDGVLFSDVSEKVFKEKGIKGFLDHECENEDNPMEPGPLSEFFQALVHLQQKFAKLPPKNRPIRTYLVTSRGTTGDGLRALKTLRERELEIDEAYFLCGAPKGSVLKAINPHIFFDDQTPHVEGALQNGVIGAYVPYGVCNK
ncbi:hypothetical protein R3I93_012671 [Phoxinus phoxinus]|uniref:Cytosolic 5'-nucleotidase 1A n=1 Tax=Phoxinus phoxinus TaxID=58324 RepID=A0AAN9CYB1_9TELE